MAHKLLLAAVATLASMQTYAQKTELRDITVYRDKKPYARLMKATNMPERYMVYNLKGKPVMEVHYGRIELQQKPAYVVTFLHDNRKGVITAEGSVQDAITNALTEYFLVNDKEVVPLTEEAFLKDHPLPAGYTDVDELIEQGPRRHYNQRKLTY
ncbi:MAG: hypothetical protein V4649_03610 [Bacteroidota bacterium]